MRFYFGFKVSKKFFRGARLKGVEFFNRAKTQRRKVFGSRRFKKI